MPDFDVNAEAPDSSSTPQTLDVVTNSVFPDVDTSATSSPAADVTEESTLSIVRDVVSDREVPTEAASSADGQEVGQPTDAQATEKEPDDENYSDVPFAKHPRFQQLLRKTKVFEKDAKDYQNVQKFMDNNGIAPEEAAEGFNIMALMRSNPSQAWEKLKPHVQNLLVAAGEVLPPELAERVSAGEMSQEAAFEFSRTKAQLRSVETNQSFREQQAERERETSLGQASYNAALSWEQERRQRDPNFEAKLIPLQKELAFIQMREGRPTPGDVAGVQNQLKRAYDAVVVPTQTAAPMQTRPNVLARPSMSGQSNTQTQAAPQTTLDIVRAARAQR